MASFIFFIVLAFLASVNAFTSSCNGISQCSDELNLQWVMDNGVCKVFKNCCAVCREQPKDETSMRNVSKEECQKHCPKITTREYMPRCATFYDGTKRTFLNEGELQIHLCKTGQYYKDLEVGKECEKPCNLAFKCTQHIDLVWATDRVNGTCKVFRNLCHLQSHNCNLLNQYKKELKRVSRKDCKCPQFCTLEYHPHCAIYSDGTQRTFDNRCALDVNICETGKYYKELYVGQQCDSMLPQVEEPIY